MEGYDVQAARLTRALKRKSFRNVKVLPRLEVPGVMEIDPGSIAIIFTDKRQEFGEYNELLRRIEVAESEEALLESFNRE